MAANSIFHNKYDFETMTNIPYKVVIVNHSDSLGGASVVSYRLMYALRRAGVDARMVVFQKNTDDNFVSEALCRSARILSFAWEHIAIMCHNGFDRNNLFKVSIANASTRPNMHPWIKEADIIVLNWVNQGMMSLKDVERLHKAGKKIVWTMHDMWNITGACHHAYECTGYMSECGFCPYVKGGRSANDISYATWKRKLKLYKKVPIHFVAVSNWLHDRCRESLLMRGMDINVIPNAFPTKSYSIHPTVALDSMGFDYKRRIILMGAARLDDPIKGLDYAIDALNILYDSRRDIADDSIAVFFGDIRNPNAFSRLKFPYCHIGMIQDKKRLSQLYATSRVVLSTSLYETLPGTLIEGMAAGCVPVSFGRGGQEDIYDHLITGYMADYKSAQSIADGITWALDSNIDRQKLHDEVEKRFSSEVIAAEYISLFQRIIDN